MNNKTRSKLFATVIWIAAFAMLAIPALAQLIDKTKASSLSEEGINKSLTQQIGAGRGDWMTPDSSSFIIARDPFRSIRRGRQLFQRKFTKDQGHGPITGNGSGDINTELIIGAGLADSCAACHGRPRGSAGVGGDVAPDRQSRRAPSVWTWTERCLRMR
jgi:hypothetical protein